MRNLYAVSTGLLLLATAQACDGGPGAPKDPPVLEIASPTRGSIQGQAGQLTVTGSVAPNAHGDAVKQVTVNGTAATLAADGSFTAQLTMSEGVTLIETVATDERGATASDTRAVQAGQLQPVGTNIPGAVTAALSADSFTKLSAAAGPLIKGLNLGQMIAPMQPMLDLGSSCAARAKGFVDDVKLGDIKVSLAPTAGGLQFSAELDQVNVPGHATFSAICIPGSSSFTVKADKVVVAGTLLITPNGMAGFTTKISNPHVELTNPDVSATGFPGAILDLLDLNSLLAKVVPPVAELAMGPLVNAAFGALAGPQQLAVLGQQLTMQVAPSAVAFDASGAKLAMNMKMLLAGSEASPGFVLTTNGKPAMDPAHGFQLGIADDLANELLAELTATGKLELAVPVPGGLFDTAQLHMMLAPSINADSTDGKLRLMLGDMVATFMRGATPVAKAAINVKLDLDVAPVANGGSVALQLGTPEIHITVLDDTANTTGFDDAQLSAAVTAVLGAQIDSITQLLVSIPVPSIGGLQVVDLSVGSDSGYVMVRGQFE